MRIIEDQIPSPTQEESPSILAKLPEGWHETLTAELVAVVGGEESRQILSGLAEEYEQMCADGGQISTPYGFSKYVRQCAQQLEHI